MSKHVHGCSSRPSLEVYNSSNGLQGVSMETTVASFLPYQQLEDARHGSFGSHSSRDGGSAHISDIELRIRSSCREGQLDKALCLLFSLKRAFPTSIYISLLKLCSKAKALKQAKQVCMHLVQNNVAITGFIGDFVVMTLAKCGAAEDAYQISATLPHRTVYSWTAIISAKVDAGCGREALDMFHSMLKEGIEPNQYTFVILFKACGTTQNLLKGKELHKLAYEKGFSSDTFVCSALVSFYSKCGSMDAAEHVFSFSLQTDNVVWNAMLAAYVEHEAGFEALKLFRQYKEEGVRQDELTFVLIAQACGVLAEKGDKFLMEGGPVRTFILDIGRAIHRDSLKSGAGLFVSNALLSMYSKCGALTEAEHVFGALVNRSIVSWNSMLSAYLQEGECEKVLLLYRQMQHAGFGPTERTLVFAVQACGGLAEKEESLLVEGQPLKVYALGIGEAIHLDAHQKSIDSNTFVGTALLSMYGKCGAIMKAEATFAALPCRDKVAWNAMLSIYIEQSLAVKALELYRQMHKEGLIADEVGIMLALQACGILLDKARTSLGEVNISKVLSLEIGECLHADAHKKGLGLDVYLGSTLISMYAKLGAVSNAENVFLKLPHHDVVVWSTMISAYVEQGQGSLALKLFQQMLREGVSVDAHALVYALQACASLAEREDDVTMKKMALEIGRGLHAEARTKGFSSHPYVGIALVSMYGKCGALDEAKDVFGAVSQGNVVSWNAMFTAYLEHGQHQKVLWLYAQMQKQRVLLDDVTLICILQACRLAGTLEICGQLHFVSASTGLDQVLPVAASLIHAYGNCASMQDANTISHELARPDLVLWNACCDGYAGIGDFFGSLYELESFELAGTKPDGVTFVSILAVCSHTGYVYEGLEYFNHMTGDYGMVPVVKHFGILLDLLGRAGDFKRIEDMLTRMSMLVSFPMWLSLLGACSTHGNIELGRQAFEHAVNLQPKDSIPYIVMSNIYIDAGLDDEAAEVESLRQRYGASEPLLDDYGM